MSSSTAWTRPHSNFLMLHADMAMVKDYTVSGPIDMPSCVTMDACPSARTEEIVRDIYMHTYGPYEFHGKKILNITVTPILKWKQKPRGYSNSLQKQT